MEATMIETHSHAGVEWGVSLASSNPVPSDCIPCDSEAHAQALTEKIQGLRCPRCRSDKFIPPTRVWFYFTCEPCGRDVDLQGLYTRTMHNRRFLDARDTAVLPDFR